MVADPLDVVDELTTLTNSVVFQVNNTFDKAFWTTVDDEGRLWWQLAVIKGIRGVGLQLGNMEN